MTPAIGVPGKPEVRLDFTEEGPPKVFRDPVAEVVARRWEAVEAALQEAERWRRQGYWVAGWLAYEAGPGLDPTLVTHEPTEFPLVWLGIFRAPSAAWEAVDGHYAVGAWTAGVSPEEYRQKVAAIREYIRQGQTYQVNYTLRLSAAFSGDPRRWYLDLLRAQSGPYAAYVEAQGFAVVSASPELFFRLRGRSVVTRPMKGTAPRGFFDRDDWARRAALAASVKDRAENVMIADLLRNDLGKIARFGTVEAGPVFAIERYPTVWQMTSTVRAELDADKTWVDVFGALFPSGSITGAPKARTMAIIREVEPDPRGVYCGALGYVAPDGDATFNVAIRTATVDRRRAQVQFGTGGGITWDSEAGLEYQEAWTKAAFLATPGTDFQLLETFRWVDGQLALKAYHLDRLRHAVEYFGWRWDADTVETALQEGTRGLAGAWAVRLRYFPDGRAVVEPRPLAPLSRGVQPVAFAEMPMPRADAWTYFKTTRRQRYEERHPEKSPFFDHLLYNAAGEVTEFTRGNLVVKLDGGWWTPALSSGLLPGTFRQWLLDQGAIRERVLTRDEVVRADQCWFINSVRGWVPVRLVS